MTTTGNHGRDAKLIKELAGKHFAGSYVALAKFLGLDVPGSRAMIHIPKRIVERYGSVDAFAAWCDANLPKKD